MSSFDSILMQVSRGLYSYAEVDHLANASSGTARRWLAGYEYRGTDGSRRAQPAVTLHEVNVQSASFTDLVEVVAINGLKSAGFSLKAIRQIVGNCQEIFHVDRPLATLKFKVGGREVFVDHENSVLIEVGRRKREQAWHDVLAPFLENLDYDYDRAARWWPRGRGARVLVDPTIGFGLPVVDGSGVRTEILQERFIAGDSTLEIADDFNLSPDAVERALQFEAALAA